MTRKLIVNADDFGRTPAVSRGILKAHQDGIVTSTTVMVNQPGINDQLAGALQHPKLGLGQHLVFSSWRPVLDPGKVPGLVDDEGLFLDQHTLWARAEEIPLGQLRAELQAQVELFEALAGRRPDHLDCHHFVHLYPPFFQVYAEMAAGLGLPLRVPFPPETDFEWALSTLPFLESFPEDLVRGMIVTNSALVKSKGLSHPDHFVGTFFGRQALSVEFLSGLLADLPHGMTELMCHPGYDDESLTYSTYQTEREAELALLTNPTIKAQIQALGIELVTFGALS
jgi:predicted glycoside hydrolase/deacetylase ChbG (UPF0249 family)